MTYVINPYRFGWVYASLAAAEASGDPWGEGDTIRINGGATFLYYSALDSNGHSGLIHKNPFDDALEVSAVNLLDGQGQNTDPDSWGWTDAGIGAKTTDYDYDVSTNSRLRKLTTAGRPLPYLPWTGTETNGFAILRDIKSVDTMANVNFQGYVDLRAYINASNAARVFLYADKNVDTTNWIMGAPGVGFSSSTQAFGTASHVFIYLKNGQATLWFNDEASPQYDGGEDNVTPLPAAIAVLSGGKNAIAGTTDLTLSTLLIGGVTAA